jgi:hypothetical protein
MPAQGARSIARRRSWRTLADVGLHAHGDKSHGIVSVRGAGIAIARRYRVVRRFSFVGESRWGGVMSCEESQRA